MRSVICAVLLTALSIVTSAQSPNPASGPRQEITLDDLQGMTIQGSQSFAGRVGNAQGEGAGGFTWRFELKIGPGAAMQHTHMRDDWVDTPRGRKTGRLKRSDTVVIGVPGAQKDNSGMALWLLEGSSLTWLRVLEVGGATLKIDFEKGASGLSCSVKGAMAREVGAGATTDKSSMVAGGKARIVSITPATSTCRVQATASVKDHDAFFAGPAKQPAFNCTRCVARCAECGVRVC